MPVRSAPNAIEELGDLSHLADFVVDKRRGQRAAAKRNRRNRHYEKQFLRNGLSHLTASGSGLEAVPALSEPTLEQRKRG